MVTRLEARQALYYGGALATSLYVSISIFIDAGKIGRRKGPHGPHRPSRTTTAAILALAFATECILTVAHKQYYDPFQAHIIYALAQTFVWVVLTVRQRASLRQRLGALLVVALFEAALFCCFPFSDLGGFGPTCQLVNEAIRLCALLYLFVEGYRALSTESCIHIQEGEARPFLSRDVGDISREGASYGTEPLLCHSETEDSETLNSDEDSDFDSDSEDSAHIKKIRAKRLRETGGWWVYIRDFSIFVPFLVPRKDRKVQACIAISLLCLGATRVLHIMVPLQLGRIVDTILAGESPYQALVIWLVLELLSGESGLGLISALAKIPIKQFSYREITNAAFSHVMNLSIDFHADKDSAEVMKAVEQGEALTTLLETVIIDILPTSVDLVIAYGILWWKFSGYASVAMVIASSAYIYLQIATSKWNIPNRRRVTKAEREEVRVMHQAVQGWQAVSHFNKFAFERRRFGDAVDSHLAAGRRWEARDAYASAIMNFLTPVTFFGLSCLVLYRIASGAASPGDFVFFIQYWDTLIHPLEMLSYHYRWLMSDLVDAERLLILLKTKPTVADKEGATDLGLVKGHVDFKNVHFSYDPRKPAVTGINFTAPPGQTIALVGMTGAGKSSILKLLLRFYDVSSGGIEIDGHDIRDITLSSLRDAIGVVPQDPFLFNASIMENLRYARQEATEEEVFAACRAAAIHDRILTFPDGYGTCVGEQGVKLSGGELQRIAIARVFLKDPPIFILDEATSAVDTNTESKIQDMLNVLKTGRTTFVIAHRLSTIVGADQILVIHDGGIIERGTHQELLRKGGMYSSLWSKQVGGGSSEKEATA